MSFFSRLFKFRIFKFRTTLSEELEDLHTESISLQKNLAQLRLSQRKWTRSFVIYALLAYLCLNIVYFVFFLSNDNITRVYAALISLTLGALLYGIYRLICWYFRTIIRMKEDRLALFKERKQELIEQVKNKEKYTVAKALLEKYGETITSNIPPVITENKSPDLRQRVTVRPAAPGSPKSPVSGPSPNIGTLEPFTQQTPGHQPLNQSPVNATPGKLPRAILPPERTIWGSILNFIVGDGPSKRYALICKNCNSHNGMALEEEFEYLSFRCAYCNYFNTAHKQKPVFQNDAAGASTSSPPPTTATTSQLENDPGIQREESTSSESSMSIDDPRTMDDDSSTIHRSIHIPSASDDTDTSRSRSTSADNQRDQSSNEEN